MCRSIRPRDDDKAANVKTLPNGRVEFSALVALHEGCSLTVPGARRRGLIHLASKSCWSFLLEQVTKCTSTRVVGDRIGLGDRAGGGPAACRARVMRCGLPGLGPSLRKPPTASVRQGRKSCSFGPVSPMMRPPAHWLRLRFANSAGWIAWLTTPRPAASPPMPTWAPWPTRPGTSCTA